MLRVHQKFGRFGSSTQEVRCFPETNKKLTTFAASSLKGRSLVDPGEMSLACDNPNPTQEGETLLVERNAQPIAEIVAPEVMSFICTDFDQTHKQYVHLWEQNLLW